MGSVRRLPSGRWRARWREPGSLTENGRTFARRRDAEAFLARVEESMVEGTYLDPKLGRVPFREWVDRWWATTMHLRPSSRARAEGIVRNWLVPRFGDRPLAAIRANDRRRRGPSDQRGSGKAQARGQDRLAGLPCVLTPLYVSCGTYVARDRAKVGSLRSAGTSSWPQWRTLISLLD